LSEPSDSDVYLDARAVRRRYGGRSDMALYRQVDALGLIGQLLDQMVPGQAPKKPKPAKPDTGYRLRLLFSSDTPGQASLEFDNKFSSLAAIL
jgi:hypothetical protein